MQKTLHDNAIFPILPLAATPIHRFWSPTVQYRPRAAWLTQRVIRRGFQSLGSTFVTELRGVFVVLYRSGNEEFRQSF